jgi:putative ABC transport system permease protein
VVVFGPVAARPVAATLGVPVARLRGVTGALARRNAMRNPRRTSGTAAALMVGVAVVTLFTVFAASLQASVRNAVSRSFGGDLAITSGRFGRGSLSPALATAVGAAPSVRTAVGLAQDAVRLGRDNQEVTVADIARLGQVVDLDVTGGSAAGGQLAASVGTAKARGWRPGTAVPVTFLDGSTVSLTVGALYENRDVVGDVVVDRAAWAPHTAQKIDSTVLIKLRPGVGLATGRGEVERVAAAYGSPTVQDRKQYAASLTEGVGTMLRIVYVLLALAVLIALMGIANTLGLSVHERTRELGLLRAVGQTRAQLRSMVRWESVVIATFGALGGLGVGTFLGWALVQVATSDIAGTFSVPAGQLAVVLLAGAAAGVLAAIRPARRAARLPVLAAISSE